MDCVNWGLELLKVAPTFIVGCIAVFIAWRQHRVAQEQQSVARAKLNFDLFERRVDLYKAVADCCERITAGEVFGPDDVENFERDAVLALKQYSPELMFLFGEKLRGEVLDRAIEAGNIAFSVNQEVADGGSWLSLRSSTMNPMEKLIGSRALEMLFSPYMDFSKWDSANP